MGKTIIERIIANHAGRDVQPGDMVDITIDTNESMASVPMAIPSRASTESRRARAIA